MNESIFQKILVVTKHIVDTCDDTAADLEKKFHSL